MSMANDIESYLARSPIASVSLYAALILLFGFVIWSAVADIARNQNTVATVASALARLDKQSVPSRPPGVDVAISNGSPFIEGASVTIAGAALLQRVAGAIAQHGGNILSSQVELNGNRAKAGFVSVIANCDIDQDSLQKLLYDIEAGMPFLFVDQLVIQTVANSTITPSEKLRILLGVTAQWQGAK
jgi:general secretion pathway protein M